MNSAAANALPPPPPPVDNGGRDGNDNNSGSNNITDGVTEKPHTRDFYSLYTLSICEGEFTADGSRMPQCHPYFSEGTSTIPALLGTTATPHTTVAHADGNIALTNSGLTYSLESALNGLDTLLKAVAVLWSLGIGFTGITFFTSIPAVSLSSDDPDPRYKYKWAVWMNLIFTGTAMFFLILGGMVAAAGAKAAEGNVNGLGADIGVSAVAGTNWIVLAWAGVALLAVALVYWTARTVKLRRDKKRDEEEAREAKDAETAGNRARAAELEKEMDILRRRMGRPPTGSQQGPPPRQSGPPLEYYRPPSPERH
ncbi:hypothetical protein C8A01DRAFT_34496 [Parachaetomium inaequale]|uniref:Uncharacterized protein n=1 Tax=Parachaetomium inaequale TaxID=2588326 RepID=A0AAN6PLR6_9PEZI|nr:hypothetical protein C8A01DRAFT_34496 [Parachaetomium inaequale]